MKNQLSRLTRLLLANLHGDSVSVLIGWPGVPPAGEPMCRQH
ncbi:hypothetical protein [Pseudomonas fulva]|nr:hypothetical protein [Pseudomonas fulva]